MAILGRINHQLSDLLKGFRREEVLSVSRYLKQSLVVFLDAETRDEALGALVDLLDREGVLHDKKAFFQAILEREKIVSTGVGIGVALPHAKLAGYEDFFIAVGIQKKKGIEWNALDRSLVRLIFMIGGPTHRQTEYLKILSDLTAAIRDEERRKKILQATTADQVLEQFEGI